MFSITTKPLSTTTPAGPTRHVDPLDGRRVSHYTVLSSLGGGAQGVVYLARDERFDRLVALKFLRHHRCDDEIARQRFIREARAGSSAPHKNICAVHGVESTDDGQPFIVMDYCAGPTLKQKLQDGALEVKEAIGVAVQISEGLAAAHREGVVHRDLKPGNLVLTGDGVKILDFGLAKLADSQQLTCEGSLLGTAAYMSPEQFRGQPADERSDVWATGVVLYEMVTGSTPFWGSHPDAIGYAIRNDPVPRLPEQVRSVAPDLEEVVLRALRKDSRGRFQAADDLARALRRVHVSVPRAPGSRKPPVRDLLSVRWVNAAPRALFATFAHTFFNRVIRITRLKHAELCVQVSLESFDIEPHRALVPRHALSALEGLQLPADRFTRARNLIGELLMFPPRDDTARAVPLPLLAGNSTQARGETRHD